MKTFMVLLIVGAAVVVTDPASAFRYEWQTLQIRQVAEKKYAEDLARAQQDDADLTGTTGVPAKARLGTQKPRAGRIDPSAHP